jgi:hypothetical protein
MIYQVIDFHNNSIQSSEKLNDINIENNIIFFTESDLIIDLDNIDNNIIMNDLYIYLKTKYEKLQLLIINSRYIDLQLFENCELNQIEYNCSNINKIYIISNSDFNKITINKSKFFYTEYVDFELYESQPSLSELQLLLKDNFMVFRLFHWDCLFKNLS